VVYTYTSTYRPYTSCSERESGEIIFICFYVTALLVTEIIFYNVKERGGY